MSAPSASSAVAGPRAEVTFERLPAPVPSEPGPHVELLFPYAGRVVHEAKAHDFGVRFTVERWGGRVQLALDDFRPVVVEAGTRSVKLGALVPPGRTLGPGLHRLFAVAVDERGLLVRPAGPVSRGPFAVVEFRVGSREPLPGDRPFIAYSQPRGTYNGDRAADGVLIDYYLVGLTLAPDGNRLAVTVEGEGVQHREVLERWQPVAVRGLPSGDFTVKLEVLGPDGKGLAAVPAVHRTITVNRDAPVPVVGGP